MLVISDAAHHQVVFPHLGIRLNVVEAFGCLVRFDLNAPESVGDSGGRFMRDEEPAATPDHSAASANGSIPENRQRNELNLLRQRLESTQRRIESGEIFDPASTLDWMLGNLKSMDREMCPDHAASLSMAERPFRLLILEDGDNQRRPIACRLAQSGFDVFVTSCGVDAHRQLRTWGCTRPDLILMDIQSSLSNGIEALHRIREDGVFWDLRVFAVTDFSRQPEIEPVGRTWDGWFHKPVDLDSLIESVSAEVTSGITHAAGM